jgi:hypothetical protein
VTGGVGRGGSTVLGAKGSRLGGILARTGVGGVSGRGARAGRRGWSGVVESGTWLGDRPINSTRFSGRADDIDWICASISSMYVPKVKNKERIEKVGNGGGKKEKERKKERGYGCRLALISSKEYSIPSVWKMRHLL